MLLPSRFQPEALPTPGPAIRKPEPVKADPIREFETAIFLPPKAGVVFVWAESKHAIRDHTKSGAAQASTAAPAISAKPEAAPPKFKKGDRVAHKQWPSLHFIVDVVDSSGVWCSQEGRQTKEYLYSESSLELLELLDPSQPTQDGLVVGKVYLTSYSCSPKERLFSRWEGQWMFDSIHAHVAAENVSKSYCQDRTVIREATEAELRGEA